MNQQAPLCFLIHFSRNKKKTVGIMSWSWPSDTHEKAVGSNADADQKWKMEDQMSLASLERIDLNG